MGGGGLGMPGGGYPRGGGGYPGGGYPGGGVGYPGGGGGYPGGGYPNGGGQYPNDDPRQGRMQPMNITVRWQSALPVEQALQRQGSLSADEAKALTEASEKDYIITIVGLRMPGGRRSRSSSTDSTNSSDQDDRSLDRNTKASNDELRSRYLDAARLVPRGKSPIYAEDVQFEGPNGATEMRFLFPRTKAITSEDKEVVFDFESQGVKFEHKFKLSDMNYQGKLAL